MIANHEAGGRLVEVLTFDCWQLLETAEIARFAWNGPRGVAMVPVNYTVADGALWFRTTPYTEHAREAGGQWVAVEVDSIDPVERSGWSVVVRGVAELLDPADVPDLPIDLTVWPEGRRNLLVRIDPVEVTGRRLLPAANDGQVSP